MNITTAMFPIEMFETRTGVVIGAKYNGPCEHRDTSTGVFYASKPVIEGAMEKLQAQILEWVGQEHRRVRREIREGGYTDMDVRHWPTREQQARWSQHKQVRDNASQL